MSQSDEDESNTQSSATDEMENYESNDADSLNLDEEEEEEDGSGGSFPLSCNLSDSLVGGSIVLHIDQAAHSMMNESGVGVGSIGSMTGGSRIGSFSIPLLQGPFESNEGDLSHSPFLQAGQSSSTTTSLSDSNSDNMSTRAVMGDASPPIGANDQMPMIEDEVDGEDYSSQVEAEFEDSEAERVRRIHNSIFNSLESDLAELVRIREETIQFLENGPSRANPSSSREDNRLNGQSQQDDDGEVIPNEDEIQNQENVNPTHIHNQNQENGFSNGESGTDDVNASENGRADGDPFFLRERLTFHSRPFSAFHDTFPRASNSSDGNAITMSGRSYTPIAKFDNAPAAKPAKPYLESGPTCCDEKAAAARKILDKLQYGDPEDESACFIRRFWRETATQETPPPVQGTSTLSFDIAAMAERTASLEATLEEAFDSIRLRLQQATADSSSAPSQETPPGQQTGESNEASGESSNNEHQRIDPNAVPYYQAWDEETSIMNNPLNYDIWNELEDGSDAGPIIAARINLAERRANAVSQIRNTEGTSGNRRVEAPPSAQRSARNSSSVNNAVSVGTGHEGAELDDDDSTDDEEISNYFRFRANNIINSSTTQNLSQESRQFFRDIGIPEELGRDLFNMFTFSEDQVQIPPEAGNSNNPNENDDSPQPLYPRNFNPDQRNNNINTHSHSNFETSHDEAVLGNNNDIGEPSTSASEYNTTATEQNDEDGVGDDGYNSPPQIPLVHTEDSGIRIIANRHDDCSTRVYLDENYLNFPYESPEDDTSHDDF